MKNTSLKQYMENVDLVRKKKVDLNPENEKERSTKTRNRWPLFT